MPGRISPGIKFDTPCHVNPLSRLRARSRNRRVVVLVTYFIASVEVRHTIHGPGGDARESCTLRIQPSSFVVVILRTWGDKKSLGEGGIFVRAMYLQVLD